MAEMNSNLKMYYSAKLCSVFQNETYFIQADQMMTLST